MSEEVVRANEKKALRLRDQQKRDALTRRLVIQTLMAEPNGRRYVWLQLSEANVFSQSETLDHAALAFYEGKRSVGLRLFNEVTSWSPQDYMKMTIENSPAAQNLLENENVRSPDSDDD